MRAILPSSLPTQPRSGSGQTQLIQSLQNWKILQKSNNQIFDVFLSIPVAEPNKAQMRFKSQNTIITVSVSEHSVSLTRVCVSKYKILDTRRFRELLARPPAATRQSPAWPSWAPGVSCHKLPQLPTAGPGPAAEETKSYKRRHAWVLWAWSHHHRQKRKQKPESLRCWKPRGGTGDENWSQKLELCDGPSCYWPGDLLSPVTMLWC